jgi:hypothetical protein
MKDYVRRSLKFIVYIVVIFGLFLLVFPLISQGKSISDSLNELIHERRFITLFSLLIAYGFVYPVAAFTRVKRHLNGTFPENREKFERAFEALNFVKTEEAHDKLVYRKKSKLVRLAQWNEDQVTVYTQEIPIILAGFRKSVQRLDRMIDQYLKMESE